MKSEDRYTYDGIIEDMRVNVYVEVTEDDMNIESMTEDDFQMEYSGYDDGDYICICGTYIDVFGDECGVKIVAEVNDTYSIIASGWGHYEDDFGRKYYDDFWDGRGVEAGHIYAYNEDEDEEVEVEWVDDDQCAAYKYLVKALEQFAQENGIDLSRTKYFYSE